jgi:tight adherence protein B
LHADPVAGSATRPAPRRHRLGRLRSRRVEERNRLAVDSFLDALVAEVRTGNDLRMAVAAAAADHAVLDPVRVAAATPYGDIGAALAQVALRPGAAAASDVALVWRVCEQTGASPGAPVQRLLVAHRARERLRRQVSAELAGPTATAYLLTALPGVGVLMGNALGADPLGFLLGTPAGAAALLGGTGLAVGGLVWTRAIARSVFVSVGPG